MTKLSQLVYIRRGYAQATEAEWTAVYNKKFQKNELFFGLEKNHTPMEDQPQRPKEVRQVQANVTELLQELTPKLVKLFDLAATSDLADTTAFADVMVNGEVLLPAVPIAHLLWLEKKFTGLLATFRAIPVLSAAEAWEESDSLDAGVRRTAPETVDYTRQERAHKVLVPATDRQAAVVDQWTENVKAGETVTVKYSTALPPKVKAAMVSRAVALLEGVKQAIPIANQVEVTAVSEGAPVFRYLLDGLL